ncbi:MULTISPECIES: bifunctional serine/threonine-protein kinase/formylglycine-generating enzyme family protein [Sorangium]|uniref:bifunctional serine/threonine-protein kinase/formylglycine-generating enzyme family protein n=1 Tax=Sorangium TaxID=39643 RepID=UPI003D9C4860
MAQPLIRPSWSPPQVIEEYRLIRLLGQGGMGQVYLAEDTLLERPVAVKFIASVRPDGPARRRFSMEARAIARLQHPNVVAVHRIGDFEGRPYLVTEFVRGQTLAQLPGPVPWERALVIGLSLARALSAAHRHGVLHRDIKPANVMLTESGDVKLLDFGLAKLLAPEASPADAAPSSGSATSTPGAVAPPFGEGAAGRSRSAVELTGADKIIGTPLYMAPEVLSGEQASCRSDLYAIGALLYELCTGSPPRQTVPDDLSWDEWIIAEPAPLTAGTLLVDPRFADVIGRCLHVDPARRFSSADALADALEQIGDRRAGGVPEGNPYRGLRPFEAEHRGVFFGRAPEIHAVIDRLRAEKLVVVVGDSGTGKSSLCRAGVLPSAAEGSLGDGRSYATLSLVPGRRPLAALAAALAPLLGGDEAAVELCADDDPGALGRSLQRSLGKERGALIFVDQLEELSTLASPEEAARFGEVIARVSTHATGARVLAAVRGDFFTRIAALPGLGDELSRALYLLRPLSPEAMRTAITGPARSKGFAFDPEGLVDELVASAIRAPGGLPLLQFAMAELWDARDLARSRITASALDAIGGVAGALARHADGVLSRLLPEQRRAARRVLLQLVTPEGMRARRTDAELDGDDPATRASIDALVRGRLLVASEASGETAYEVAHEALVQGWDSLRRWLDADGEKRPVRERVAAAAAEWIRLGRSQEALWGDRQLAEAAVIGEDELPAQTGEFLRTSRKIAARRRRWRRALIVGVPLVIGLSAAGLRIQARHELDRTIAGYLEAGSAAFADGRRWKAEADELRREAFARFDAAGTARAEDAGAAQAQAEATWASAIEASRRADDALSRAEQLFNDGLRVEPARPDLRDLLGDVLVERIGLAELFHADERRTELVRQLDGHDDDRSRRGGLARVPRLSVEASPAGAEVRLERYERAGSARRLVPIGSLGRAPLHDLDITPGPGSYRLTFVAEGRAEVRWPLVLARGERLRVAVELPARDAVPEGYVYVPPGRFLFGSADVEQLRRGLLAAQPMHEVRTGGFLIGRTEVTYAAWIRFLDDLPPSLRDKHTPGARSRQWAQELERLPDGDWQLALELNAARRQVPRGELAWFTGRSLRERQDWQRFPVAAISLPDAEAYVHWLDRTGRLRGARLCSEHEWERAARGADDRRFPHGDALAPDDANFDETYGRKPQSFGPDEVGSHPASESPFGVLDMTGNVYEWTRSAAAPDEAIVRGGAWYYDQLSVSIPNRTVVEPETRDVTIGLRVCADFPPR